MPQHPKSTNPSRTRACTQKRRVLPHVKRILGSFHGVDEDGHSWLALCPAHDDTNPSLAIDVSDDGKVLLCCRSQGCETRDIVEAAGLSLQDLFPPNGKPRIVATYDYPDETGKLQFQVVRYEPKSFKRRKPNGNGGWTYTTKGVRNVPYRLPSLVKGKKYSRVYIVEGEKDADRLADLGLIATTNAGGAGKWDPDFNRHFRGRPVVIIPDNDDAGFDSAARIADSLVGLAMSVRVLELPNLPAKGDVDDWLDIGGNVAELRRLADAAKTWVPGRSTVNCQVSGEVATVDVPTFPAEVFPKCLRDFITTSSQALPCAMDLLAVPMLAALGVAIGDTYRLELKPGYVEGPRIYSAVIARPGDRKSPALSLVTQPLYAIQRELRDAYEAAMDEYEEATKEQEGDDQREKPVPQQVITTDATIESMAVLLNQNPRGLLFEQDELSGWTLAMGQYKGSRGNDRQKWLSFWSGKSDSINRKGQDAIHIDNPFVCVAGCIQPDMLGELVDRQGRDDGFLHRVLLAYPDPVPVKWSEVAVDDKVMRGYSDIIYKLWGTDDTRNYDSQTLSFTPSGYKAWLKWVNPHNDEQNSMTDNFRGVWMKLEAYCARLSLILHRVRYVAKETRSRNVDGESVKRAGLLSDYFKAHTRRAYQRMRRDGDTSRLGNAVRWIRSRGGTVTARELERAGLPGIRNGKDAKTLLSHLAEANHGTLKLGHRKDQFIFTLLDT